jgi:hypothetical protein
MKAAIRRLPDTWLAGSGRNGAADHSAWWHFLDTTSRHLAMFLCVMMMMC